MSRMATMQVLNQAFNNLNHAMNNYTQNQNMARRTDLMAKEQELEELWRKRNFDAAQALLGWNNERTIRRDAREQEQQDWLNNFKAGQAALAQANLNRQFNAAQRQQELSGILSLANNGVSPEVANAFPYALRGDPTAMYQLANGIANAQQAQRQYELGQKLYADAMDAVKTGRAYAEKRQLAQDKFAYDAMQAELNRQASTLKEQGANNQKTVEAFMNFYKMMSANVENYSLDQAVRDFAAMQQDLKPRLTPAQIQEKVKSGEWSEEEAYNYARSAGYYNAQ